MISQIYELGELTQASSRDEKDIETGDTLNFPNLDDSNNTCSCPAFDNDNLNASDDLHITSITAKQKLERTNIKVTRKKEII